MEKIVIGTKTDPLRLAFGIQQINFSPIFNGCPGMEFPVITNDKNNHLQSFQWGYLLKRKVNRVVNFAPCNGIIKNEGFRDAIRIRRCIIPVNCFIVADKEEKYLVYSEKSRMLGMAGVYMKVKEETGAVNCYFCILTQPPNELLSFLNQSFQPLLFDIQKSKDWVQDSPHLNQFTNLMKDQYPARQMNAYKIAGLINNKNLNDSQLLLPIGPKVKIEVELPCERNGTKKNKGAQVYTIPKTVLFKGSGTFIKDYDEKPVSSWWSE